MSLLEQDNIRKKQIEKKLKSKAKKLNLKANNNFEYEVEAI